MLVVYFVICFSLVPSIVTVSPSTQNENSKSCIIDILQKHYRYAHQLVYVDINAEDFETIKAIHLSNITSLVSRKSNPLSIAYIDGYLIHVSNTSNFIKYFPNLTHEIAWNPGSKFLIVVESLHEVELRSIFDKLLKHRVFNVVVLNKVQMYTYNPFENYACGNYYNRIISLGTCIKTTEDLFTNKLVNGLKNCIFNVGTTNWPPYAVEKRDLGNMQHVGVEELLLMLIAEAEQFRVNFSIHYDAEIFTTISSDLSALGPMNMLQNNETDIMLGGLMLIQSRASAFDYLHGHLDNYDTMRLIVKKASLVPLWKQFYIEFQPLVWTLIFVGIFFYSTLLVLLLKAKDKCDIFMKVLDTLFLHGFKIRGSTALKLIFMIWILCAYIINCFYQSSLSSLTTMPSSDYQISEEKEILQYNLKPCLSNVISGYKLSEFNEPMVNVEESNQIPGCKSLLGSIKTVGNSSSLFTFVIYSIYRYNRHIFLDDWGDPSVYVLPKPMLNIIYSMYTYKGFPLQYKLNLYNLRLRESGLVNKFLNDHYYNKMIQHHYKENEFKSRILVPWLIYVIGIVLSALMFALEIIYYRSKSGF